MKVSNQVSLVDDTKSLFQERPEPFATGLVMFVGLEVTCLITSYHLSHDLSPVSVLR